MSVNTGIPGTTPWHWQGLRLDSPGIFNQSLEKVVTMVTITLVSANLVWSCEEDSDPDIERSQTQPHW